MSAPSLMPRQETAESKAPDRSKDRLLQAVKRLHTATAQALADELGLSVPAIRRHLQDLQEQGLLSLEVEKPGGRGRPQHVYRLTESGEATFPKKYEVLCSDVLHHLGELYGHGAVLQVMDARRAKLYAQLSPLCRSGSTAERLGALCQQLEPYGYAACAEQEDGQWYLVEHNCPAPAIAREFPELCQSELELYETLLGCRLVRETRIVCGAGQCRYRLVQA